MKKSILVTGGAGYIGSHTIVALSESGYEPIIVDNFSNSERGVLEGLKGILGFEVQLYEGDCRDVDVMSSIFERNDVSGVIHFAAYKAVGQSVKDPLSYYQNNIGSLLTLLAMMKKHQIFNLVFSSSCTVYGQPKKLPVTEDTECQPAESPYGTTKLMCEKILEDIVASKASIKAVALRYFNPIGAHPSALIGELPLGVPDNLIPFVTQVAAGIREKLTIFGDDYNTKDGSCVRDYIHVMDLAKAHVKAFEFLDRQENDSVYDVFNVGTGNGHTVLEVVEAFQKVTGVKLNYAIGDRREGDVEKTYANADKIQKELHWKAELTLEDALRDAWKWQQTLQKR